MEIFLTQKLVEIPGDHVPVLSGLVSCQEAGQEALGGDDVDLVDGLENEVQDSLLLEKILPVSKGAELVLLFFVFWKDKLKISFEFIKFTT